MVASNTSKQDGKQKNSLDPSFFSDLYFKYAFFPRQPASLPIWCHLVASDTGVARPLVHPHRLTHNQQGLTLCCNISFRDYSETNLMCSIQAKKVKIIAKIVCSLSCWIIQHDKNLHLSKNLAIEVDSPWRRASSASNTASSSSTSSLRSVLHGA